MAYVSDMVDEFRMYMQEDDTDELIPLPRKIALLNAGIRRMFPRLYTFYARIPDLESGPAAFVEGTYEYELVGMDPAAKISQIQAIDENDIYIDLDVDDVRAVPSTPKSLRFSPAIASQYDGQPFYVIGAVPISPIVGPDYNDLEVEEWTGPADTLGIPVLYAMAMASSVYLDNRLKYDRASVVMQQGAASPTDIMTAATFWTDRFEKACDDLALPTPQARF